MPRTKSPERRGSSQGPERPDGTAPVNEVVLRGRLTAAPQQRTLPSGDRLVRLRVSVPRPERVAGAHGRAGGVDWVNCAVWAGRLRVNALRWRTGDLVELSGALRRRYFRPPSSPVAQTRLEVEVHAGRRVARARPTDRPQSEAC
ncbi:MAG: single-stranded DNA-binding protein [Marmoricola sp.]